VEAIRWVIRNGEMTGFRNETIPDARFKVITAKEYSGDGLRGCDAV
jgi:hypothetical protein